MTQPWETPLWQEWGANLKALQANSIARDKCEISQTEAELEIERQDAKQKRESHTPEVELTELIETTWLAQEQAGHELDLANKALDEADLRATKASTKWHNARHAHQAALSRNQDRE